MNLPFGTAFSGRRVPALRNPPIFARPVSKAVSFGPIVRIWESACNSAERSISRAPVLPEKRVFSSAVSLLNYPDRTAPFGATADPVPQSGTGHYGDPGGHKA